ncbi:MAG: hypothetical protein IKJ94_06495 [Oscillospiraceae bacterium]|nr:hypothetical protein [Oscillospiraceae bacterium]
MKQKQPKDLIGIQIRRQYFNIPIFIFLSVLLLAFETVTFVPLFESNFSFNKWLDDIFASVFTLSILIIPCVILSVLNRFFFGKIICVLNEEGIYYTDGLIKWDDILGIRYHITFLGRTHFQPACVDIACKKATIQIKSAPLYMLSVAKKYNPDINIKKDRMIWILVASVIVIPIIASAVV